MPHNQKETTTVTSSGEVETVTSSDSCAILADPERESYMNAWELMMQDFDKKNAGVDPPLDALGRIRKDKVYKPATDDIACDDRHPAPYEDQGDGKDAYGNPVSENDNMSMITTPLADEHRVVLFRDHSLELPELNLKVFLVGPPKDCKGFPQLFARAGCVKADTYDDADVVVFTGGPDVDPCYYGMKPVPSFWGDSARDDADLMVYWNCYNEGIPMIGVCRGAQFGAVMAGYKLVQDIDQHSGDHSIWDKNLLKSIERISSVHHQCVIPGLGMEVLAYATTSTRKFLDGETLLEKSKLRLKYPHDCEAFFIREHCFFGVQGHPEYRGYNAYAKWFLNYINELIILNPDVDLIESPSTGELRRRLKADFMKERETTYREKYEDFIASASDRTKKKEDTILSVPSDVIAATGE